MTLAVSKSPLPPTPVNSTEAGGTQTKTDVLFARRLAPSTLGPAMSRCHAKYAASKMKGGCSARVDYLTTVLDEGRIQFAGRPKASALLPTTSRSEARFGCSDMKGDWNIKVAYLPLLERVQRSQPFVALTARKELLSLSQEPACGRAVYGRCFA